MPEQEEWRTAVGFPDYRVSDTGRVISYRRRKPRELRLGFTYNGYPQVRLCGPDGMATRKVHHLVGEAFIGPRPAGLEVRHLDGDKTNNHVSNIAYGTRSENIRDQVAHGAHVNTKKTECCNGHPFDDINTYMHDGRRRCRTCRTAASRASAERRAFRAASVPSEAAA